MGNTVPGVETLSGGVESLSSGVAGGVGSLSSGVVGGVESLSSGVLGRYHLVLPVELNPCHLVWGRCRPVLRAELSLLQAALDHCHQGLPEALSRWRDLYLYCRLWTS
jgi:hypothetical protein